MTNTPEQPEIESSQKQLSYSIEQVASRTGLTKRTLRYYEEVGLLPPTDRTGGNYRRYSEADIQILERVKELRDLLGFSLSEIRELLDVEEERGQIKLAFRQETDAEAKIAQLERSDELIHRQLELVDQKINGLQQMRATLLARLERHKLK
ncbi:MAG: MerR family transcriptional regulator, partial [Ktedonobacteraceae bacterium]|nr:MerR family transcriptional regulator [Ktedonobacteraceae bacterium]